MSTLAYTDLYEYTMLDSMVREGIADQSATFEAFARRLPQGRRFGIVAGQGRFVELLGAAVEGLPEVVRWLRDAGHIVAQTSDWLYRLADKGFSLDIAAYPEGGLYWPGSPVMQVRGSLGEGVLLETLILSILNHDSAIASAAARMRLAAGDLPLIEMGGRRVQENAAVAAARAAYIGGFTSTSNLAAGMSYGIPVAGTAAHAWTLAHGNEYEAFCSQLRAKGHGTTLLVDTFNTEQGIVNAVAAARDICDMPGPRAIRIDSGDPTVETHSARALLDRLGAHDTGITLTGDMDEYIITGLLSDGVPVAGFGVGTRVATGSGHPTAGFVYKLVEIDRGTGPVPVAKKSASKVSAGGRKTPYRTPSGEEFFSLDGRIPERTHRLHRNMATGQWSVAHARMNCALALDSLPAAARDLTHGQSYRTTTHKETA